MPFALSLADSYTGVHAAKGILSCLIRRETTGEGGHVEVSLLTSVLDLQFEVITTYLNDGQNAPSSSTASGRTAALPRQRSAKTTASTSPNGEQDKSGSAAPRGKETNMDEKACYFEDYQLGDTRTTGAKTITETDIVLHADQTGDFFPHHIDAEFCKNTEFGQRIANGTLTFSVGVGLTASFINPVAFSYGYDRLRFIKPVFINDAIRAVVTVSDKKDHKKRPNMSIVTERLEVLNQRGETVMVGDHLLMCQKREA